MSDFDAQITDLVLSREACRSGLLLELRQELDLSQSDMACAAGCSRSTISLIERGLVTPRAALARRLAGVLVSAIAAVEAARP